MPNPVQGATSNDDVDFGEHSSLKNARKVTLQGRPTSGGGCIFPIPEIQVQPGENAKAAYQRSANFKKCTTVVEIGELEIDNGRNGGDDPNNTVVIEPTQQLNRVQARQPQAETIGTFASGTKTGYYRTYWQDIADIEVNSVKVSLTWSWNGTCVTQASSSATWTFRSGTGWTNPSRGAWQANGCLFTKGYADAQFQNKPFCYPVTVDVFYDNVSTYGYNNGALAGYTDNTWETLTGVGQCLPLHYHTELVPVSG